ncbi:MAG: hypothetical protein CMP14_12145 [Rickettsiales bacterium]|jgi:hypothetical protein|nr:hypothetical protein [Rickettsiales bacterium]|tara:strand:- start:620 stop:895 length:276 start_codon:yes stop_codon:yes gene_type:complete
MKVKELVRGMWLQPKPGCKWMMVFANPPTLGVFKGTLTTIGEDEIYALYLGTRQEIGGSINRCEWSNRYALFQGRILPIDSADWRYIQPAI